MGTLVLGTAGHVDHGKTALVRALTGVDLDEAALDRLKDEQRRGITIDLGFAHARLGDVEIAFVDVPGHERFVRNMLAGAGGFDAVLLVVAADESVKPQTREHVNICRLLGIERGLIALSKVDLVDSDAEAVVALEIREFIAGTFLADAPIVPVSVRTGAGLDAIRRELARLATLPVHREVRETTRVPVDRAFSVKGFGTVVTGTLLSGAITDGDELEVLPAGRSVRVRGVHVHNRPVSRAEAPRRVAVNLGGHVALEDVPRGVTLATPATLAVTRRLDAEITLLKTATPLRHGSRVRLHLGTSELGARVAVSATRAPTAREADWRAAQIGEEAIAVAPGGSAYVRLRLDDPVASTRGDRFVLRAGSPVTTIGGGSVLDPEPPTSGLRRARALARFNAIGATAGPAPSTFLVEAGGRGLSAAELVRRAGLGSSRAETTLRAWAADGLGLLAGDRLFDVAAVASAEERLISELTRAHAAAPEEPGVGRETLRERVARATPALWFDLIVRRAIDRGLVTGTERLALASHKPLIPPADAQAREAVERALRTAGLTPPDVSALGAALGLSTSLAERAVRGLVADSRVVRVGDLIFHADALSALKRLVGQEARVALERGLGASFDVAEFKRRHGLSRKYAIPLLEWLDRERVTRRVGDRRVVI